MPGGGYETTMQELVEGAGSRECGVQYEKGAEHLLYYCKSFHGEGISHLCNGLHLDYINMCFN